MSVDTTLCDGRGWVRQALEEMDPGFTFALRGGWPRTNVEGDAVFFGEHSNTSTDLAVVDEVSYFVVVRCEDWDRLWELTEAVNEALLGLGLRRQYTSPDEFDEGFYTKTLRFGRRVDKRGMRLIN